MKFWFADRFNRADFYGAVAFMTAIGVGASPLVALPAFLSWAVFSAFMSKRLEKSNG